MMGVGRGRVVVVRWPPRRLPSKGGPEEEVCIDVVLHAFETLLEIMSEGVHGSRQQPAFHAEMDRNFRSGIMPEARHNK